MSADYPANLLRTVLGNFLPPAASLITAPILAHALSVEGRGELAAATAPFIFMTTAATLGMPEAVTHYVARFAPASPLIFRRAIFASLVTGAFASLAVLVASGWLAGGERETQRLILYGILALVPALAVGVVRGVAAGHHRWDLVAWERAWSSAIRFAAIVLLALTNELSVLSATVVVCFSPLFGILAYLKVLSVVLSSQGASSRPPPSLLRYGSGIALGNIALIGMARIDHNLLLPLAGSASLGLFVVAVAVADIPSTLTNAFREVIFASESDKHSAPRLSASVRLGTCAGLIASVSLAILSPYAIPVFFGADFSGAVVPCIVLLLAQSFMVPGVLCAEAVGATGGPYLRAVLYCIGFLAGVCSLLLLAPMHGAVGAAVSKLVSTLTFSSSAVIVCTRRLDVSVVSLFGIRRADLESCRQFLRRRFRKG